MLADLAQQPVIAQSARVTTVRLGEYYYRPKRLTVRTGSKVRFLNVGKIEHTVADTDARHRIRSKLIRPRPLKHGASQTVSFTRPGTVHYLCTFHPTLMRGVLKVVR
jgi:plastocyanin